VKPILKYQLNSAQQLSVLCTRPQEIELGEMHKIMTVPIIPGAIGCESEIIYTFLFLILASMVSDRFSNPAGGILLK
jgi:hypothetical protein